ncbi:MAG: polyprenyl diphosphate synthase [Candidatus Muiribacteriaceae bacterium]
MFSTSDRLPVHIAVIMDGNGRWAARRHLPRLFGHKKGVSVLKKVCSYCLELGIPYLTVYAFSTENWNRPGSEVEGLMGIFRDFLKKEAGELIRKDISLRVCGDVSRFPGDITDNIEALIDRSADNSSMVLNVALNYGARDEILRAVRRMINDGISPDEVDEEKFRQYLFNPDIPDPDMLIRTSGEVRISNFLLFQTAYTELFFTECLWPDFDRDEFDRLLLEYSKRDRRYGKV